MGSVWLQFQVQLPSPTFILISVLLVLVLQLFSCSIKETGPLFTLPLHVVPEYGRVFCLKPAPMVWSDTRQIKLIGFCLTWDDRNEGEWARILLENGFSCSTVCSTLCTLWHSALNLAEWCCLHSIRPLAKMTIATLYHSFFFYAKYKKKHLYNWLIQY